jgi:ring-1,2-phenylacetyl-CoA epoxidase subunit PaaE
VTKVASVTEEATVTTGATVTATAETAADNAGPRPRSVSGVFYPLTIARTQALTADSAAITFAVPDELAGTFAFDPGQSLTIRRGGERRCYSICSPAGSAPRPGCCR